MRVSKGSLHLVLDISPHTRPLCESFPQCVSVSRQADKRQVLGLLHNLVLHPLPLHPSPVFRQGRNRSLQLSKRLSNTKVSLSPNASPPSEATSSSFSAHPLCCESWFMVYGLGFRFTLFHIPPPPSLSNPPPHSLCFQLCQGEGPMLVDWVL